MSIKLLHKALEAPPPPRPWYENSEDSGALGRVYGPGPVVPAYEYPAFMINTVGDLIQDPEHAHPRYNAFKVQFNILCDHLISLNKKLGIRELHTEVSQGTEHLSNAAYIEKFRRAFLCGYNNMKNSQYSHQATATFEEIKYNLEVILNAIIKNNDKKTMEQVVYSIAMCEGGVEGDFKRLKTAVTEPNGVLEFLEIERSRITDALAQKHIQTAASNHAPINIPYHQHVGILFGKVLELHGVALPQTTLKDIYIPIIKIDPNNPQNIIFLASNATANARDSYQLSDNTLTNVKKDFDNLYTAENITDSLANYLNEKIEFLYDEYIKNAKLLAIKMSELNGKKNDLKKQIAEKKEEFSKAYQAIDYDEINKILAPIRNELNDLNHQLSLIEKKIKDENPALEHPIHNQKTMLENRIAELSATLKEETKKTNKAIELIKEEIARLERLLSLVEKEMRGPTDKLFEDINKLMILYGVKDFNPNMIINDDTEDGKVVLKPREERLHVLYAKASQSLASQNLITGIQEHELNEEYNFATDGSREWFVDKNHSMVPADDVIDYINIKDLAKFIQRYFASSVINDQHILNRIIDKLSENGVMYEQLIHDIKLKYNLSRTSHQYIIKDLSDIKNLESHALIDDNFFENSHNFDETVKILLKSLSSKNIKEVNDASIFIKKNAYLLNKYASSSQTQDYLILAIMAGVCDLEKPYEDSTDNAIQIAVRNGRTDIINLLFNTKDTLKIDFQDLCNRTLIESVKNGDIDVVNVLLERFKINPNMPGHNLLEYAIRKKHLSVIIALLNNGASKWPGINDLSEKTSFTVFAKVDGGGPEPMLHGTNHRVTPLIDAIIKGNLELVRALIKAGADVNIRSRNVSCDYMTPLMYAVGSTINTNTVELVKILVNAGANIEAVAGNSDVWKFIEDGANEKNANTYAIKSILLAHGANMERRYQLMAEVIRLFRKPPDRRTPEEEAAIQAIANSDLLKKLAYSKFEHVPQEIPPFAAQFAAVLLAQGQTTSYIELMHNTVLHTVAAFYGFPVLFTLANVKPGSDDAYRLYAQAQLCRLMEQINTSGSPPSPEMLAKCNAFTAVINATENVSDKLVQALTLTQPAYSRIFHRGPVTLPAEISQQISPPKI